MQQRVKRLTARLATLGAVAALGLFAGPAGAHAAGGEGVAEYDAECGNYYVVIDHVDLADKSGTVYLTYDKAARKKCVVTNRTKPGTKLYMEAYIQHVGGSGYQENTGNFGYYAGPVYVSSGTCVDWGGRIGGYSVNVSSTDCV